MVRLECLNVPVSISEFKHQLYEGLAEEYTLCISQLKLQGISDINKIIDHIHDQGVMIEAEQNLSGDETANYVGNRTNNGRDQIKIIEIGTIDVLVVFKMVMHLLVTVITVIKKGIDPEIVLNLFRRANIVEGKAMHQISVFTKAKMETTIRKVNLNHKILHKWFWSYSQLSPG